MNLHPAAQLLPEMPEDEYVALRDDIEQHGQQQPVVIDAQGRILDGRHRARAVAELGFTLKTAKFDGNDPIAFVLGANVHRRHLTPSQRAAVAVEAEALYAVAAAKRVGGRPRKDAKPTPDREEVSGEAIAQAAKQVGASRTSAAKAKAVKKADPALFEKVKAGDVAVDAAEKQVSEKIAYAKAVEEFPELAPEQSPGLPPSEVVRVANDLRAVPEGPEREKRRESAATWHRAYAARTARSDEGRAADEIIDAVERMTAAVSGLGASGALEVGLAASTDAALSASVWLAALDAASAVLDDLRQACRPALRRVK